MLFLLSADDTGHWNAPADAVEREQKRVQRATVKDRCAGKGKKKQKLKFNGALAFESEGLSFSFELNIFSFSLPFSLTRSPPSL